MAHNSVNRMACIWTIVIAILFYVAEGEADEAVKGTACSIPALLDLYAEVCYVPPDKPLVYGHFKRSIHGHMQRSLNIKTGRYHKDVVRKKRTVDVNVNELITRYYTRCCIDGCTAKDFAEIGCDPMPNI